MEVEAVSAVKAAEATGEVTVVAAVKAADGTAAMEEEEEEEEGMMVDLATRRGLRTATGGTELVVLVVEKSGFD